MSHRRALSPVSSTLAVVLAASLLAGAHGAAVAQARSIAFRVAVPSGGSPTVQSVRVQFASTVVPPPPAITLTRTGNTFEGSCPVGPGVKAVITPTLVIQTDDAENPESRFAAMACDFTDPKDPSRQRYRIERDYAFTTLDVTAVARVADGGRLRTVAAPCMARIRGYHRTRRQWVDVANLTRPSFTALGRMAMAQLTIPLDRHGLDFSERMEVRATFVRGAHEPNLFTRSEWRLRPGTATQTLNLVFGDPITPVRIALRAHLPRLGIDAEHTRNVAGVPLEYDEDATGPEWSHLLGGLPRMTMPISFTLGNDQEGDNLMHEWGHHFLFTMDWQPSNTHYLVLERSDTAHTPGRVCDGEHLAWEEALCHVIGSWGLTRYLTARSVGLRLPHSGATMWQDNAQDAKRATAMDGYNGRVLRDKRRGRSNVGGWIEDVVTAALFAYYQERGVADPERFLRALFTDLRAYCTAVTNQQDWCAEGFFYHVRDGLTGPLPTVDERRIVDQIMLWYRITTRTDVVRHGSIDTLVPVVAEQAGGAAPVQPGAPVEILGRARAFPRLFETSTYHPIVARLTEGGKTLAEARFKRDASTPGLNAVAQFKPVFQKPGPHAVRVEVWGDFVDGTEECLGRSAEFTVSVARNQAVIELEPALFRPEERIKARIKLQSPSAGASGTWRWSATGPLKLSWDHGDTVNVQVKGKGKLTARLMASPGRGKPPVERARADLVVEPMKEKTYTIPINAVGKNWFLQAHIGHGAFNLKNFMSRVFLNPGDASGQVLWKPTPRSKKQFAESWYTYIPIQVEIKGNIKVQATGVFIDQFGEPASIIYLDPGYPNWVKNTRVKSAPARSGPSTWDRKTNSGGAMLARFRFVGRSREMQRQKDLEYGAYPRCMIYYRYDIEMWKVKDGKPTTRCGQDWTCHTFGFQVLTGPPPGPALTVGPGAVPTAPAPAAPSPPKPARVFKLTLNDPGRAVVEVGERLPLSAVFTLNGKPVTAGNFVFHWQPHPEADFEAFESTKPATAVRFKEAGPVKVWVSALERTGEVLRTVAEAQHIELTVLPRNRGQTAPPPTGSQPAPARPPARKTASASPAQPVPPGPGGNAPPAGQTAGTPPGKAPAAAAPGGTGPAGKTPANPAANPARPRDAVPLTARRSTLFKNELGQAWAPLQAAGGSFDRFAKTGRTGLVVRCPGRASWARTGIKSMRPFCLVDPMLAKQPVEIAFTFDTEWTSGFCIALCSSPPEDPEKTENVLVQWTADPGRRGSLLHLVQSRKPGECDRRIRLPGHTPREVVLRVSSGRLTVMFDGKQVAETRVSWLARNGAGVYPCVFASPRTEHGACAMTLRRIQACRLPATK